MQVVFEVQMLPDASLEASAVFARDYLADAIAMMEGGEANELAVVLPPAGSEHDAWRRALAGDLARSLAPRRANVIATGDAPARDSLLTYLRNAPGVTGQYLAGHE